MCKPYNHTNSKGTLVPGTEDFDRERDHIHFLGCKQLCVTKIRPNAGNVHMIFDIKYTSGKKSDLRIEKKKYAQAVKNMERVYRMMDQMESPEAKLFV